MGKTDNWPHHKQLYMTDDRHQLLERAKEQWPDKSEVQILFDALRKQLRAEDPAERERHAKEIEKFIKGD